MAAAAFGNRAVLLHGRCRIPLETVLRIHLLQHVFNHSGPAMEEALYEVPLYCRFVGLDLAVDTIPDETTICKFRYWLEKHRLADRFLAGIDAELQDRGLPLSGARCLRDPDIHDQAIPVFHQQMPRTGLLRRCALALSEQQGILVSLGFVRIPTAILSVKVDIGVTACAAIIVPSTLRCSLDNRPTRST